MDKDEQKKKNPAWIVATVVLGALGLFFRFMLRGYAYWGYLCFFLAALILAHHFLPASVWRIVSLRSPSSATPAPTPIRSGRI